MGKECNHVFIVRGSQNICEKCGDICKLGDFVNDSTEFQECVSGRCPVI